MGSYALRGCTVLWERQTCEAAIDIQCDQGWAFGCLFTEKVQLCEQLRKRVLITEKHRKGAAGLWLSVLGAGIQRH